MHSVKKERQKKETVICSKEKALGPFFFGAKILVDGFNQSRLLSQLNSEGIKVYSIQKESSSKMRIILAKKDHKKAFATFEKLCYNYTVEKEFGAKTVGRFLLNKLALILAATLCIFAFVYAYGFVFEVRIDGLERLEREVIENFLGEHGVSRGSRKSRIDENQIVSLLNGLEEVLVSSVEITGTSVIVTITEKTLHENQNPGNEIGIFSNFDATITRVNALSGTPAVAIGDRVFRGARLIGAYRLNTQGVEEPYLAKGNIYGEVTIVDTAIFSLTQTTLQRTGRRFNSVAYSIFGRDFRGRENTKFEFYETETTTSYAFQNLFIPLRSTTTVYFELIETITQFTLEQRVEQFLEEALLENAIVLEGASNIKTHYEIDDLGLGQFRIATFITAEVLIGSG